MGEGRAAQALMAKKKKRGETVSERPAAPDPLSVRGKKVILCGIATIALGFVVLTRADSRGRNWAGVLSPFLILGGYAVVACGIYVPDPAPIVPSPVPSPLPRQGP